MSALTTSTTELPESRVRVEAQVSAAEVEKSLERAARSLGRDMRIPGFRKGKVPAGLIIQRVGREVVLDEAIRETLPRWYVDAIDEAGIAPVGDPNLDVGDLPQPGEPLSFSIEIGVLPAAKLGTYKGVEVGRADASAGDDAIDAEIEALRERAARLETIERAAGMGDFVVADFVGSIDGENFAGGEGRDQMLELGSGRFIPGFEEQLQGATAGEERTIDVPFPDDYQAEHLAGKNAQFAVTVKEVKEKKLPEIDDDFASESAGFDTLDELREDIAMRIREKEEERIERSFRELALDAVVAEAEIDVPDALVEARARELWDRMMHQLSHQGISKEMYMQMAGGREEEELLAEARPDAEQQLRREAVLTAIVAAEKIEITDDELLEALAATAEAQETSPKKLIERLKSAGRIDEAREDLAQRRAIDLVVESAQAISVDEAQSKDKLFTPESDESPAGAAGA